jgi:sucrose-6-phosphate hydrolase SacC (GH32 family)
MDMKMKRMLSSAILLLMMASAALAADTDKTLVVWVTLADQNVRAGSILTIQSGSQFDGIVFAEKDAGKWMAGSDYFNRTHQAQDHSQQETAGSDTVLQMAIVYKGSQITIYRNADLYASYPSTPIDLLSDNDNLAVFGLRHVGGSGSISGAIEDARIYPRALTVDELQALKPNEESDITPYAWWDFEDEQAIERSGTYPHYRLAGGAKLADGKLVLGRGAALVAGRSEAAVEPEPFVTETPTWPDNPPPTWLTYHLAHPGPDNAIPADPNCAIFYKGRYHLHYIYNRGGPSFAHLTSTDMVHWQWQPTVLTPRTRGHGMFSGTAFLTREGKPAIIYHGQGSGMNQIAFALDDDLSKWSESIAVEPRTTDGKPSDMRQWDPDCWLMDGNYYALGGGSRPTLAKSSDLKEWEFLGELLHPDFPSDLGVSRDEDISCANMFRIGDQWMLLCISHALGARYYLGDFKDEKFLPQHHAMMNWARWDFFAPESLLTPDGRRVMWAWCTPWVNEMQKVPRPIDFQSLMNQKKFPAGIQSLPRELSLREDGVLRIKPLHELEQLRTDPKQQRNITVKSDTQYLLKGIAGDTMELEIIFDNPSAGEFGIKVLCGEDGSNGFTIAFGNASKTLKVGYSHPPFALQEGEDLTLRVFVDKSMIEVFANDRQAAVAWHEYDPADVHVSVFGNGGSVKVKSISAWNMKSIHTKAGAGR